MNIILSPHFDDAVLSLGGLLAKEGHNSLVATFFAGIPSMPLVRGWDTASGFKNSTDAMKGRAEEDARALDFLGVSNNRIRRYAHLDGQYRRQKGGPVLPEPELEACMQQEIESLIREFGDTSLKIFAPGLEVGKVHRDHTILKRVTRAVMRALPAGNKVEFFFYQDIPYAMSVMDSLYPRTAWNLFMRRRESQRDYSLLERNVAYGSLKITPVIIALEKQDMEKKLSAVALYASQTGSLGKERLFRRIERFSAGQARTLSVLSPYCEVVYTASLLG